MFLNISLSSSYSKRVRSSEQSIKLNLDDFTPWERVVSSIITGDFFGADRIDYLLRDAQYTGLAYGVFDYHQLIEMLRIVPSLKSMLFFLKSRVAGRIPQRYTNENVSQQESFSAQLATTCGFAVFRGRPASKTNQLNCPTGFILRAIPTSRAR